MMLALLVSLLAATAPASPPVSGSQVELPTAAEVLRTLPPVREERPAVNRTSKEWIEPPVLPRAIDDPRLVVRKSKRQIQLLSGNSLVRTYRIALGLEPVRPKERRGDYATPEGTYYICTKNPQSRYALSLGLSYPGPADADRGVSSGLITHAEREKIVAAWNARSRPPWNTKLGGEIMIHGNGASWDWTEGCIALNGQDIEELYRVVPVGTSVEILP
jgi:lipoprotein-anchoring transpeptidase ErfK/SrfK